MHGEMTLLLSGHCVAVASPEPCSRAVPNPQCRGADGGPLRRTMRPCSSLPVASLLCGMRL